MIVARRDMTLNGSPVVVGQILDTVWPTLRELARRNLLRQRWVEEVHAETEIVPDVPTPARKRGRPKGAKNKPKPVAQASA